MLMIKDNSEKGFSYDIPWLRNLSQVQYTFKPLAWLGFWGVNQPCTAGNDRFHVARGLWPTALFVWRVVLGREVLAQLAAVPLPLWPNGWGLFGPHQPGRLASRRLWRKRWRRGGWVGGGGGSDRGEELLAEHPSARLGRLPTGEKTSPLTPRSSRLCGDRDLSLHLKGQHHPIVICLNNLAYRTALKTLQIYIYFFHSYFWTVTQAWI